MDGSISNWANVRTFVFRIGGDEFAVIAPYIPPEEKVLGVIKAMKDINVEIDYMPSKH